MTAKRVYDELYAEYRREITEEEVVSRLGSGGKRACTTASATPEATGLDRRG
jgi:hypothetical protein